MTGDPFDRAVCGMLRAIGIPRDSRDHGEYERGRKAIARLDLPQRLHESAIKILTEWMGI